jgi:hypothetical protein
MHFNKMSDYNLILNFFHKAQIIIIIIFVLPMCNPSTFQQELHTLPATDCLLGNFEEVLQANLRITTCQETQRQCQPFSNKNGVPVRCVLFSKYFLQSN